MNMKTKSPKLKVTHDYITLSLPVGNYTVSFNGRKASGQLATMKGAFATLNKYVDQESKTKSYGTHISFNYGTSLVDGYIREKTKLDKGDISFLIETEDGKFCRVKHRMLDLFYIYKS